jgi:hypothetical protein
MNTTENKNHAIENAIGWLGSIHEMVAALENGGTIDDEAVATEQAQERIQESVLSVEVRTSWHTVGNDDDKSTEYNILLTTGGPALRIIGDLDKYCQPENARLEWQDWGTPWTEYRLDAEDDDAVLTFAQQFYFGE